MRARLRPSRPAASLLVLSALAAAGAGCGTEPRAQGQVRPPTPILVSAVVSDGEVAVSPARFGAGPITLDVANLTGRAQRVTFESAGRDGGFRQQTGPINPRDTAQLQADLPPGEATIRVEDEAVSPATVRVGPTRESAQDQLLQP